MNNEEHFNFLIMRDRENGLIFVALDSVTGYIRHLAHELSEASWRFDDPSSGAIISRAFELLSDRLEEMEPNAGGGQIDPKI